MPEMTPVDSSNIAAIGWADNELYIEFNSGSTYVYADVPESTFERMMDADSQGKFFHANIRGQYDYDQV